MVSLLSHRLGLSVLFSFYKSFPYLISCCCGPRDAYSSSTGCPFWSLVLDRCPHTKVLALRMVFQNRLCTWFSFAADVRMLSSSSTCNHTNSLRLIVWVLWYWAASIFTMPSCSPQSPRPAPMVWPSSKILPVPVLCCCSFKKTVLSMSSRFFLLLLCGVQLYLGPQNDAHFFLMSSSWPFLTSYCSALRDASNLLPSPLGPRYSVPPVLRMMFHYPLPLSWSFSVISFLALLTPWCNNALPISFPILLHLVSSAVYFPTSLCLGWHPSETQVV